MSRLLQIMGVVFLASLAGCNQNLPPTPAASESAKTTAPASGGVAVIDIDLISEKLNLTRELQTRAQGMQQHFDAFKRAKQAQIIELQKKLGEKPTEEQIKEFRKADAEGGAALQREQANSQQQFNEFKNYLVNVLEATLKEPLEKIMKQRGLTIILHARQGVYRSAPSADITQEVLDILAKDPNPLKLPTTATVQPTGATAPKSSGVMPELPGAELDNKSPRVPGPGGGERKP